jgi:hypothetical protein
MMIEEAFLTIATVSIAVRRGEEAAKEGKNK